MLRGIKSEVPILKNSMIEHCCPTDVAVAYMGGAKTWEQAKGTLSYFEAFKSCNTYTTTLHVINSGIVKTSKLTFATKVYRGISDMALPAEFWVPNRFGVRGGVENGFLSTTTVRDSSTRKSTSKPAKGMRYEAPVPAPAAEAPAETEAVADDAAEAEAPAEEASAEATEEAGEAGEEAPKEEK